MRPMPVGLTIAFLLVFSLLVAPAAPRADLEEIENLLEAILVKKGTSLQESSPELEEKIRDIIRRQGKKFRALTATLTPTGFRWPVLGKILSKFGWRIHPIRKARIFHTGVDIAANLRTDIKAAATGVVLHARWLGGYGLTVILDHGGGVTSLYAHCAGVKIKEGERVYRERVIASVGQTGQATGPHLHFEIRRAGIPLNPAGPVR